MASLELVEVDRLAEVQAEMVGGVDTDGVVGYLHCPTVTGVSEHYKVWWVLDI